MIGGSNIRCVRVEPPWARCTSATAIVTLSTILFSSGVHVQSGLWEL